MTIGGRGPFRFLLDTGSTHSAVTAPLAAALDAEPVARTVDARRRRRTGRLPRRRPAAWSPSAPRRPTGSPPPSCRRPAASALGPGRRRPRAGLPVALRLHDRLPALADRLARRRLRRAGHPPGAGAGPGSLAGRAAAAGQRPAPPPPLRRFVPDSGADTLVLFGEARRRCLIAEWRAGRRRSRIADRRAGRADGDGRRPPRRQRQARSRRSRRSCPSAATDDPDGLLPLHLFARVFFSARSRALVVQPR